MHKTPFLTVDCVVFHGDSVVLIRRGFEPFKGWYALPGGFVDIGESVEAACAREMKEETGLKIDDKFLRLIGVYSEPDRDPRSHTVSIAFLGESDMSNLQAGDDAVSVELVSDWINKDIAFDHMKIIKDAWHLRKKNIGKNK
jgi:8-oxo-dGTP diphosphatase